MAVWCVCVYLDVFLGRAWRLSFQSENKWSKPSNSQSSTNSFRPIEFSCWHHLKRTREKTETKTKHGKIILCFHCSNILLVKTDLIFSIYVQHRCLVISRFCPFGFHSLQVVLNSISIFLRCKKWEAGKCLPIAKRVYTICSASVGVRPFLNGAKLPFNSPSRRRNRPFTKNYKANPCLLL